MKSSTSNPDPPAGSTTTTTSTHPETPADVNVQQVTVAPKATADVASSVVAALWLLVFVGAFAWSFIQGMFHIGEPRLEIVVAAQQSSETSRWTLTGRILFEGLPVPATNVWAILSDDQGNRFSPTTITNGPLGEFQIRDIPPSINGTNRPKTLEATVQARAHLRVDSRKKDSKDTELKLVEGKETLALGERGGIRWVKLPLSAVVPLLSIFFGSIVLALLRFPAGCRAMQFKYYGSVFFALVLTVAMVIYLSIGLLKINLSGTKGEVVALGFANIFHGTSIKDVEPEWLLSFTAPTSASLASASGGAGVAHGFGAPLWVLFMAVLGSGIFTLLILIRGINDPVDLGNEMSVGKRLEEIVRHQFYILFSPVGAIFVYQLMVVAGMTQPVTLAMVALAAGIALNLLLDRALELVHGIVRTAAIERDKREAQRKAEASK
jgi:hypothetical protein